MVDNKTGNPLPFGTLGVHKVRLCRQLNFKINFYFRELHSKKLLVASSYLTFCTSMEKT